MPRLHLQSSTYRKQNAAFKAALAANAHKGDAAMAAALETAAHMGRRVGEALKHRNENVPEATQKQLDYIATLMTRASATPTQIGRIETMDDASKAIAYLHACLGGKPILPETRARVFVLLKADAGKATKEQMYLATGVVTLGETALESDGRKCISWLEARADAGPDDGFARPAPQPATAVSTGRPRFDPRRKPAVRVAPAPQPVAVAPVEEAPLWFSNPDFVPYIEGDTRFTGEMVNRLTGEKRLNWEAYDRRNDFHDHPGYHYVAGRAEPCRVSMPIPKGTVTWLCEDQSIPEAVLAAGRYERLAPVSVPTPAPVVTAPRPARVVPGRPATLPPARPATPGPVEAAAPPKFVRMGTIPLEHGWHPSDDLIPF